MFLLLFYIQTQEMIDKQYHKYSFLNKWTHGHIYNARDHLVDKVTKQISYQWMFNQLIFKEKSDMISKDNLLLTCQCNKLSSPDLFLS